MSLLICLYFEGLDLVARGTQDTGETQQINATVEEEDEFASHTLSSYWLVL